MLELRNVSYRAGDEPDAKEIINHVSLTIDQRFVALTGPNGAYDLLEEDLFRTDLAATLQQFQSDVSRDLAALYKLCYDAATSERTIRTTTTVSLS
jgi:hypothetical protein